MFLDGDTNNAATQQKRQVIFHLDLDAFYAQVEHRRLNIPREIPVGVQQWGGIIARNYPMRALGIPKGMNAEEVKDKFPEVQLVRVEVLELDPNNKNSKQGARYAGEDATQGRNDAKASLRRYRVASFQVMDVIRKHVPLRYVERASIDEAYIDVTELVKPGSPLELTDEEVDNAMTRTNILGDATGLAPEDYDLRRGAALMERIRRDVLKTTEFTMSGGVATNKILAKIASAHNKPNKQTVVPRHYGFALIRSIPLKKVPGLGGELGRKLLALLPIKECAVDASTTAQISAPPPPPQQQQQQQQTTSQTSAGNSTSASPPGLVPGITGNPTGNTTQQPVEPPPPTLEDFFQMVRWPQIVRAVGQDTAKWVLDISSALDNRAVKPKMAPKSLLSAKSFTPISNPEPIKSWLRLLVTELFDRAHADAVMFGRIGTKLTLHYATRGGGFTRRLNVPRPNPFLRFALLKQKGAPEEETIQVELDGADEVVGACFDILKALPFVNRLALGLDTFESVNIPGSWLVDESADKWKTAQQKRFQNFFAPDPDKPQAAPQAVKSISQSSSSTKQRTKPTLKDFMKNAAALAPSKKEECGTSAMSENDASQKQGNATDHSTLEKDNISKQQELSGSSSSQSLLFPKDEHTKRERDQPADVSYSLPTLSASSNITSDGPVVDLTDADEVEIIECSTNISKAPAPAQKNAFNVMLRNAMASDAGSKNSKSNKQTAKRRRR